MITQNITIYLFLPSLYHYKRLAVHEENFQDLRFLPGAMNDAVDNVKDTTLMSYFKAVNIENNLPILPNDRRPLAQALTYVQFCKSFTFQNNTWTRRKQKGNQIGRLYSVFPSAGDKFYLRMLLCQVEI